jgi:hypothetical protein
LRDEHSQPRPLAHLEACVLELPASVVFDGISELLKLGPLGRRESITEGAHDEISAAAVTGPPFRPSRTLSLSPSRGIRIFPFGPPG